VPELPEVEVLVRHLAPLLRDRTIHSVKVGRARVLRPTSTRALKRALGGASFGRLSRRGKYLLFEIYPPGSSISRVLVGHLGMSGRMYLLPKGHRLPKYAAVVLDLGEQRFVFEDTRYFGRLTLDVTAIQRLGPEPLSAEFNPARFARDLKRSRQPIKVKLLDQSLVAGVGNIYASEALYRAGISPRTQACRLVDRQVKKLLLAIRETLAEAISFGSTLSLNYAGAGERDRLFYFGRAPKSTAFYEERLRVYDRTGKPCVKCGSKIKRIVQAARSTFYCPGCQRL
jgi:formamidopyrimidine-DNA glycosylase